MGNMAGDLLMDIMGDNQSSAWNNWTMGIMSDNQSSAWNNWTMDNMSDNQSSAWNNWTMNNNTSVQTTARAASCMTRDHLTRLRTVTTIAIVLPIAVVGIIANLLAFAVLCKQRPRMTTTILLQALALVDVAVLLQIITIYSLRQIFMCMHVYSRYRHVYNPIFNVLYPLTYFCRMTNTWLTVLLTIDRYIAVCRPLQAQRLCTVNKAYKHLAIVTITAFIFSLPRFMEILMGLSGSTYYTIIYRIVLFSILMYLLPMSLLFFLNSCLLRSLRKANVSRAVLQGSKVESPATHRSITIIVVCIVVICFISDGTALVTHTFWALAACFEQLSYLDGYRRYSSNIRLIVVTINSAINFIIYFLCSKKFRQVLVCCISCRDTHVERRGREPRKSSSSMSALTYLSLSRSPSRHSDRLRTSLTL